MDSFWQEAIAHIKTHSPHGSRYAAPDSFKDSLRDVIPYSEITGHDLDEFAGLVIHKGWFEQIDASFLYQILERAVPTFANPVFIVLEMNGPRLPARDKHLGALREIMEWAKANAEPSIRRLVAGGMPDMPSGVDDAFLTPMVDFIVEYLVKAIDPAHPNPAMAVAETAERFNDTAWFWVDDTGKTAELFAVPKIRDAHPALADAMLDFMLRLSPESLIHRRAAVPELKIISADPEKFHAHNSFFNLTGDLTKGVICPSIRYNDDRTRLVAQYSGNLIRFHYRGRRQAVDIENSIKDWSIAEHADRIVFSHTSEIRGRPLIGSETHVCDVTYRYTLWRARPTVEVAVVIKVASRVTLENVQLTTAFDQISPACGFTTAVIACGDEVHSHQAPDEEKVVLTTGPADYLCLYESTCIPGFANGLHARFRDGSKPDEIIAEGSRSGKFHWVYARYGLGNIQGDETKTIIEDRLLTGGGYYNKPQIYRQLMVAAETGNGETDPSVSYDIGAELNAVAVTLLFANRGLYQVSPPSEERLQSLKAWYDRHLDTYLEIVRPGEDGERQRVFVRGLSFVILSLDCMARAYPFGGYQAKLHACVQLMLRLEDHVRGGMDEALFGPPDPDHQVPELDCQVSALLALARAAHWNDPDRRISGAIRRALRAISLTCAYSDPGGQTAFLHDTMLIRNVVGGTAQDTGFWNFKLGLALRAFSAIRQIRDLGSIYLDGHTSNHLEMLDAFARLALRPSMRWEDGKLEVLTSQKAGETNSETQPWVALGLEPAIEWEILGKPLAATPLTTQSVAHGVPTPEPVIIYFDQAAPPMHVEWECPEKKAAQLLQRVADTWAGLGASKPHWSVLSNDQYLPSNIEASEFAFFATGEHDRNRLLATIRRVGRDPGDTKIAHEFGCGLGRLTNYLAESFERVIACDVSHAHLDLARARSTQIGRTNIDYRLATLPDFGMTDPFDLWYTIIVLQHNPPPIMALILRRALSLLRPNGLAIFQIPTYSPNYRFDVEEYLASPVPPLGIEMHFLPQWALFKLVQEAGCTLLEVTHDGMTGGRECLSNTVVVTK